MSHFLLRSAVFFRIQLFLKLILSYALIWGAAKSKWEGSLENCSLYCCN